MGKSPTKTQATEAARSFKKHEADLGEWKTTDLLMGLGRLYQFPPGTPAFKSELTIGNIAGFILDHAVEIE